MKRKIVKRKIVKRLITIKIGNLNDPLRLMKAKGELIFLKQKDDSNIIYMIGYSRDQIEPNKAKLNYEYLTFSDVIKDIKGLINNSSIKYSLELEINPELLDNPLIQSVQKELRQELPRELFRTPLTKGEHVEGENKIIFLIKEDCLRVLLFRRISTRGSTTFYFCGGYTPDIPDEIYQFQLIHKGTPEAIIEDSSMYWSIESVAHQIKGMNVNTFKLVIDKKIIKGQFPYLLKIQTRLIRALKEVGIHALFKIEGNDAYKKWVSERLSSTESTMDENLSTQTTNSDQTSQTSIVNGIIGLSTTATSFLTFLSNNNRGITKMNATTMNPIQENATQFLLLTANGLLNVLNSTLESLNDAFQPLNDSSSGNSTQYQYNDYSTDRTVIRDAASGNSEKNLAFLQSSLLIGGTAIAGIIGSLLCLLGRRHYTVVPGGNGEASSLLTRVGNRASTACNAVGGGVNAAYSAVRNYWSSWFNHTRQADSQITENNRDNNGVNGNSNNDDVETGDNLASNPLISNRQTLA